MAQIPVIAKVFWALGVLILGNSFLMAFRVKLLDIDFANAPPIFKGVMYFLSCALLLIGCAKGVVNVIHSWHKMQSDRIKNDILKDKYAKPKQQIDETP